MCEINPLHISQKFPSRQRLFGLSRRYESICYRTVVISARANWLRKTPTWKSRKQMGNVFLWEYLPMCVIPAGRFTIRRRFPGNWIGLLTAVKWRLSLYWQDTDRYRVHFHSRNINNVWTNLPIMLDLTELKRTFVLKSSIAVISYRDWKAIWIFTVRTNSICIVWK